MSIPGYVALQRAALPNLSGGPCWGQFETPADLVNVAGSAFQIGADLQAGDTAWVESIGTLYFCSVPTPGAAVWDPIQSGSALSLPDIYVSDINGDDSNSGTTPTEALKTLAAAFALLPLTIGNTRIHVGTHGGSGYAVPDLPDSIFRGRLWIYGDGAGQPGDDGFTELLSDTTQAGTIATGATAKIVSSGGLTINAFQGRTLLITSGAAAGTRRLINSNDATDIFPDRDIAGLVVGDSYRVVEPSVVFDLASNGGARVWAGGSVANTVNMVFPGDAPPGLYVANLFFDGAGSISMTGSVVFYGAAFNLSAFAVLFGSEKVYCGYDSNSIGTFDRAVAPVLDFGVPTDGDWLGWGLNIRATAHSNWIGNGANYDGFIVGVGINLSGAGRSNFLGGFLHGGPAGGAAQTILLAAGAQITAPGVYLPVGTWENLGTGPAVQVDASGGYVDANRVNIRSTSGSACVANGRLAAIALGGSSLMTVSGGVYGADAKFGASIISSFTRVSGTTADTSVNSGVAVAAKAFYAAPLTRITDADASMCQRNT